MKEGRSQISSRVGFVLVAAGSAVGLGNIWKFPYIAGEHGGGLFVLVYLGCIAVLGLPILLAEMAIGRAAQAPPVAAFGVLQGRKTAWTLVGVLGVATAFLMLSYYVVVAGWALQAVVQSLTGWVQGLPLPDAAEAALQHDELVEDGMRSFGWAVLFLVLTIAVVARGVSGGIEATCKVLMPALILMMIGMTILGATRGHWEETLEFVFVPDWERFRAASVLEALGHAFFTLSIGVGAMITYGSYRKENGSLIPEATAICLLDTFVAILACLMLFPVLLGAGQSPSAGPGLVFVSMPVALESLGAVGPFAAVVFFGLLVFAALSSSISLLEVAASTLIDKFDWGRVPAAFVAGGAAIVSCALPAFSPSAFRWVDSLVSSHLLPIGGLGVALYVGWALPLPAGKLLSVGPSRALAKGWRYTLRWVAPVLVLVVYAHSLGLV